MPPAFALSQDQTLRFISDSQAPGCQAKRTRSRLSIWVPLALNQKRYLTSVSVTHKRYTSQTRPFSLKPRRSNKISNQSNHPEQNPIPPHAHALSNTRTPPTYPFLAYANCQRTKAKQTHRPQSVGQQAKFALLSTNPMQIGEGSPRDEPKQEKPSVSAERRCRPNPPERQAGFCAKSRITRSASAQTTSQTAEFRRKAACSEKIPSAPQSLPPRQTSPPHPPTAAAPNE